MSHTHRIVSLALALTSVAAIPFALACAGPPPLSRPPVVERFPTYPTTSTSLVVSDGIQSGAMGEIVGFEGVATHHDGSYYGSGASVRIDSEGDGWWVMSRLDVSGDLAGSTFAPGAHRTYTSGISDDPSDTSSVTVTGCSGPVYGDYTFDTQAETVEISVGADVGGARRVDYVTTYGSQVTRGSFTYQIPSSTGTTTVDGRGI